ncbi:MAG: hypothetical protein ACO39G_07865 [Flavobacteriaceae bacterium]
MKKLHVIQAYEHNEEFETDDYKVTRVAYKGFSRGYGEFMELTSHLADGEWISFQPHDVTLSYEELASCCDTSPVYLFQLSVSNHTNTVWQWLKQGDKRGWHEVNFVEIMTPVFRKEFFDYCKPTFAESKSGYGLDFLWAKLHRDKYGKPPYACYDYTMDHPGHVTSNRWVIDGKGPFDELRELKAKYKF